MEQTLKAILVKEERLIGDHFPQAVPASIDPAGIQLKITVVRPHLRMIDCAGKRPPRTYGLLSKTQGKKILPVLPELSGSRTPNCTEKTYSALRIF